MRNERHRLEETRELVKKKRKEKKKSMTLFFGDALPFATLIIQGALGLFRGVSRVIVFITQRR